MGCPLFNIPIDDYGTARESLQIAFRSLSLFLGNTTTDGIQQFVPPSSPSIPRLKFLLKLGLCLLD
jgi:hypothetical protein